MRNNIKKKKRNDYDYDVCVRHYFGTFGFCFSIQFLFFVSILYKMFVREKKNIKLNKNVFTTLLGDKE